MLLTQEELILPYFVAGSLQRVSGPHYRETQSWVLTGAAGCIGNTGQVPVLDPDLPWVISSSPGFALKTCLPSTARTPRVWGDGSDLIVNKFNEGNVIGDELLGAWDPGMLSGLTYNANDWLPPGQSFAS